MIHLYAVSLCVAMFKKTVSKVKRGPLLNSNFYGREFYEIRISA